ncbi:MAG: hypothetical protein JJ938_11130 [Roseicyclus sp.]|nr:hypothetical protein [Roseicyclus sp.]MBO6625425.1 hypothetical protein [Roseicyclus sp.]MBO6923720.1 hypothetical protein [Roseicyclus sp.]
METSPVKVFFVYRRSSRHLGSTTMRAFQLSQIAQAYCGDRFTFETKPIPNLRVAALKSLWVKTQPKGAIYIFVKDAVSRLDAETLSALRHKSRCVAVDYIDRTMNRAPEVEVDLHICSSIAQHTYLTRRFADAGRSDSQIGLIFHHADIRLHQMGLFSLSAPRIAYFGGLENAYMTPGVAARVPCIDVGLTSGMDAHFRRFREFNLHYAVRPQTQSNIAHTAFKPFTKGAIAAACGAPIIVNRPVHDAVHFLGDDYPFLVESLSEKDVTETIDHALDTFGGPVWLTATERMREINDRLSPYRIGRDLEDLLKDFL